MPGSDTDPVSRFDGFHATVNRIHNSGDFINVLFADYHVKGGKRADVGIGNDNIYSSATGTNMTEQGAGTVSLSDHDSEDDSFLIGPVD